MRRERYGGNIYSIGKEEKREARETQKRETYEIAIWESGRKLLKGKGEKRVFTDTHGSWSRPSTRGEGGEEGRKVEEEREEKE